MKKQKYISKEDLRPFFFWAKEQVKQVIAEDEELFWYNIAYGEFCHDLYFELSCNDLGIKYKEIIPKLRAFKKTIDSLPPAIGLTHPDRIIRRYWERKVLN